MTTSKHLGLRLATLVAGAIALTGGAHAAVLAISNAAPNSICHSTASAARQSARREAQAEYWITVAKCLNGSGFGHCQDEAEDELEEAFELANEQYEARLDLCALVGQGAYDPQIDPDDFSTDVDNAWFPLVPGRTLVYEKRTKDGVERLESTTLTRTVEINGVECRRLREIETLDGEVGEDTIDFFAQHENGDVWYLGEVSQSFEDGFLDSLGGSWRFGKDGAKPGILMLGDPDPLDAYRQEFLLGEAEDFAKVLAVDETVHVPFGTFEHCVLTRDASPLEPGNFEKKYYAPGIGLVLEVDPESGERLELVDVRD